MPVRKTPAPGYVKRDDGMYHKPYGKGTTKGGARKGKVAGSRLAFDDTKDSRKSASAASTRAKGVTTKKGMSRKGTVAGARLAYDDSEGMAKGSWMTHLAGVHAERQKEDPSASYRDSMKEASLSWK